MHLWRTKNEFKIEDNEYFKSFFSQVQFQRLKKDLLLRSINELNDNYKNIERAIKKEFRKRGYDRDEIEKILKKHLLDISDTISLDLNDILFMADELETQYLNDNDSKISELDKLNNMFDGNLLTSMLIGFLSRDIQLASSAPEIQFDLYTIQKKGNIIYAQSLLTIRGLNIKGFENNKIYYRKEYILASTYTDIIYVETDYPSFSLVTDKEEYSFISNWLFNLRVLE
ncbi:MAG: hypothetical protein WD431_03810 [Cyclobacteriaceae bacterium]